MRFSQQIVIKKWKSILEEYQKIQTSKSSKIPE